MQRSCCIPPTLLYFLRANSFKTSQPWKTMRLGSGECGKDIVTRCFKIKSSELPGLVCLLAWFGLQFPRFSKRACLASVLSVCSCVYCITLMVSCPPVARERRRVSAGYCRGRWKCVPRPRCRSAGTGLWKGGLQRERNMQLASSMLTSDLEVKLYKRRWDGGTVVNQQEKRAQVKSMLKSLL